MTFFRFSGFADWAKDILPSLQKRFKSKLAGENAMTRLNCMEFTWNSKNGLLVIDIKFTTKNTNI